MTSTLRFGYKSGYYGMRNKGKHKGIHAYQRLKKGLKSKMYQSTGTCANKHVHVYS